METFGLLTWLPLVGGKAKGGFPAFEARKWNYTTFLILPTVFARIVPLFAHFLLREIVGNNSGKLFRVHPLRFWLKIALLIGGVMNGDVLGAEKCRENFSCSPPTVLLKNRPFK